MNLGRDERCAPRFELTESARLAPVLGAAISSWRVEVDEVDEAVRSRPQQLDYVGRELTTTPNHSIWNSWTYNCGCT